jgi:hypothetical protein
VPSIVAAASDLVRIATTGEDDDKALRIAVSRVLKGFNPRNSAEAKKVIAVLDRGTKEADGRAAQVLSLALGALVEGGASPEHAWPTIARDLPESLERATRFARACTERAGTPHVDTAMESCFADVAVERPRDAAAWLGLPARCLAAVACLTRSRAVRKKARATDALARTAYPLEDAVAEVGFLSLALSVADGEPLLVVHPSSRRAVRVVASEVATNVELFVLLADALVGKGKTALLSGKRPDARAVASIRGRGSTGRRRAPAVRLPFDALAWPALRPDGTLDPEDHEQEIPFAAVPSQIPLFDGERVVLLRDPTQKDMITAEPTFDALRPTVTVKQRVGEEETGKLLAAMGKAAAGRAAQGRRRRK